jgi:hypothetical protein
LVLSASGSTPRRVEGVVTLSGQFVAPSKEQVEMLGRLAAALRKKVQVQAEELRQRILAEAKNLDLERLSLNARPRITVPGIDGIIGPRS